MGFVVEALSIQYILWLLNMIIYIYEYYNKNISYFNFIFENTKSDFCTIIQEYYFFHFTIIKWSLKFIIFR